MYDGGNKVRKTKHPKRWSDLVVHCAAVAKVSGDQLKKVGVWDLYSHHTPAFSCQSLVETPLSGLWKPAAVQVPIRAPRRE